MIDSLSSIINHKLSSMLPLLAVTCVVHAKHLERLSPRLALQQVLNTEKSLLSSPPSSPGDGVSTSVAPQALVIAPQ